MPNIQKIPIRELFNIEKGTLQSLKSVAGEYTFVTASEEWKTHKEYTHECEALIFAMGAGGSLGRTHYIKGKFIASDLCFILTPKDEKKYPVNLRYYFLYFNFIREKIVAELARGMAKKAINKTNFSDHLLPYIPIDQQNTSARKGMVLSEKIKDVEKLANSIKNKTSILLKKMLAESVKGEELQPEIKTAPVPVSVRAVNAPRLFDIQQAVALILKRFERGEMVVAKMLYLAQSIYQIPLGIQFSAQNFGPYDSVVKKAVTAGLSPRNKFFAKKGSGGMQVLSLGANANKILKYSNSALAKKMNYYLNETMSYFSASNSNAIERLATICKIIEDTKMADDKTIKEKLHEWKPNKFKDAEVSRTIAFIKKNKWDAQLAK